MQISENKMKEINNYMEEAKTIIEGLLKLIVETSICLDKIPEYHTQTFNRGCVFTNNYNLIKEVMQMNEKSPDHALELRGRP